MNVHLQRFSAFLLSLVLCASLLILPATAAEEVTSTGTLWSYLSEQSPDWLGTVIGGLFASACPTSEDNKHHGKVIRPDRERGKYIALCDHCSHEFPVYDDDLDAAYGERVTNIQNNYGTTAIGTKGILYPLTPSGEFIFSPVSSSMCSADKGFSSFVSTILWIQH